MNETVLKINFEKEHQADFDMVIPPARQEQLVSETEDLVGRMVKIAHREEAKEISITDMAYIIATLTINVLYNSQKICGLNNEWLGFTRMFYGMLLRAFHGVGVKVVADQDAEIRIGELKGRIAGLQLEN